MTTINRATWIDDDGSGATGTIINNARLQGDVYDKVDQALATLDAKDASQDAGITAAGPHKILSAQHTDSLAATLVAGDLLRADATGKLARLAAGVNGQLLNMASGLPAWADSPVGGWQTYAYNSANLSTATGTFTAPGAWDFRYLIVGKLAFVSVAISGAVTTAATAWVRIVLPPGMVPALANQNLLGTINPGTLTATNVNLSSSAGGVITWYPNVALTGTIPAISTLGLNASLFYPLP
jgi:hypothetical protein